MLSSFTRHVFAYFFKNYGNLYKSARANLIALFLKCFFFFYQRTETNSKQTMRFHPRKIICLGRFLITLLFLTVSVVFLNILSLIFTYLHILSHFSVRDIFALCYFYFLLALENDLGDVKTS